MNTTPEAPKLTADDIPMEFTLEGLRAHFSDAEIAAMNEGDDPILPGVDLSAGQDTADGEDAADGEDTITGEDTQPAEDATPAPVVAEPEQDPPPPVNLAHYEKTVADLDTKLDELQQAYDDGDLTSAEWKAQLADVVKAQAVAQMALENARTIPATPIEEYRETWFSKVTAYQDQHAYLSEPDHFDNWDAALKMVNTNGAYAKLTMSQKIEQAHRIYAAHYEGLEGKPLPTKPGLTTAQKQAAAAESAKPTGPRTDPRPEAPTTLAELTNASDGGLEDGRFAQIDRVADSDALKGEQLFSQMSEADQIAYLRNA